jgi:hypothetical protein
MRRILLAVAVLGLVWSATGCVVATTTTHGVPRKSLVVLDDDVYVVDLKDRTARKVALIRCEEAETVETITIEAETPTEP